MKRRTYTKHHLTDAMLRRLSAIAAGRRAGGVSLRALEARGLIEMSAAPPSTWVPTRAGDAALRQARQEGW